MTVRASVLIAGLAPEVLEHLRRADGWTRLERLELSRNVSLVTRRRVVYYLRDRGAPIAASVHGYRLADPAWTIPGIKVEIVTGERRVLVQQPLSRVPLGRLIAELDRRGFTVTRVQGAG